MTTRSAQALVYWAVIQKLDRDHWHVLDLLLEGREVPHRYRFQVAFLIAIECVEVTDWGPPISLKVTAKGEDGHDFFREEFES